MNDFLKYDPEDIESLLLHKQFHELYPEEKEFVLRHLESEAEYESLRKTLFELHDASKNDEWLEPDAGLKRELMREFASERRKGFLIWLNSLFALPEIPWYRQRGFAFALGSAAVLVAVLFFMKPKSENLMSDNAQQNSKEITRIDTADIASVQESPNESIDVPPTLPPAPEVLLTKGQTTSENFQPAPVAAAEEAKENMENAVADNSYEVPTEQSVTTGNPTPEVYSNKTAEVTSAKSVASAKLDALAMAEADDVATINSKSLSSNAQGLDDLLNQLYTAK